MAQNNIMSRCKKRKVKKERKEKCLSWEIYLRKRLATTFWLLGHSELTADQSSSFGHFWTAPWPFLFIYLFIWLFIQSSICEIQLHVLKYLAKLHVHISFKVKSNHIFSTKPQHEFATSNYFLDNTIWHLVWRRSTWIIWITENDFVFNQVLWPTSQLEAIIWHHDQEYSMHTSLGEDLNWLYD